MYYLEKRKLISN